MIHLPLINKTLKNLKLLTVVCSLLLTSKIYAQGGLQSKESLLGQRNVITTAAPFLLISPDSRSAAMGDLGAATSADANSIHWNASKLAFIEGDGGMAISAAPWLRTLVPDIWFYYMSGYKKIDDKSTVGLSLRYFTLGNIQFTDNQGTSTGDYEPKEYALDGAYARKLSDNLSLGVALRFVFSDLARGQVGSSGTEIKAGMAGAGDISMTYKNDVKFGERDFDYTIGGNISNIGNKITYTTEANRDFIPVNLRLGTFWNTQIDEYNEIGFGVDFNKLLVPTPQYKYDSLGEISERVINDDPLINGMLSSFSDAPGGFREELNEITISAGLEYWYAKQFALRAGYFYEADTKGSRKYMTFGAGLKYNVFQIDAAYLQPFARRHPLQNTIRFSLYFDLDAFKNQEN
ncbi:MAG: type IX secretion system outer membrane channel protein PorV [Bacteroidia bacterium]|nr:type IX secretion system outer membrane channel protein PorV [Bacteroidia bacterium]|tara:strand:- start:9386 stop:10600 length:1215 start_codon:yes stop_codon:yes gene_type:complete